MEKSIDESLEQTHFEDCLKMIRQNVSYYEEEYGRLREETTALLKAMKTGDPELYNQAMTSASLEANAEEHLPKNRAALKQPYFGRIDYTEKKPGKEMMCGMAG